MTHFKVFGSIFRKNVPNILCNPITRKCVNGTCWLSQAGAYILCNPITRKLMISRDIIIDENEA